MGGFFKDNLDILVVMALAGAISIMTFSNHLFWDSAVYIGMGKYIYSLGQAGLWESSRPLIWPLILGLFWKIGLNPVIVGKVLGIVASLLTIFFTFKISNHFFDRTTSLLAAFILSATPIFINIDKLLTAIPSTLFGLIAIYYLIKKKHFHSGLFASLAFMTRFVQLIIGLFILVYILSKKKKFENSVPFIGGFAVTLIPYLVLNVIMYKNPFHPFFLQLQLTKVTGWIHIQPWFYYFIELVKQNYIFIFMLVGLFYLIKKKKHIEIVSPLIMFIVLYSIIAHKEPRFIITFLPYLIIVACYGLFKLINKIENKKIANTVLVVIMVLFLAQTIPQVQKLQLNENFEVYFNFMNENLDDTWISNPKFAVYSDNKVNLLYYPVFNTEKALVMIKQDMRYVLWNSCDLACNPKDLSCESAKFELIKDLRASHRLIFDEKEKDCQYYILAK